VGLELSRTYVRPDAPGRALFIEDFAVDPGDGFALVDDDTMPFVLDDLLAAKYARAYGEAIHVTTYDGPAGELCGTFLYEHAIRDRVVRALAFSPNFGGDGFEHLRWERIEGDPEPWEAGVIPAGIALGVEEPVIADHAAAEAAIRYWALPADKLPGTRTYRRRTPSALA
jgi:hypothetical protein